jgi:hypothetical protein
MTHPHERALEAAARALSELHIEASLEKGSGWRVAAHRGARAAVTAYLAEAGDGRLSELERENAALREALKPFAELGATNWTLNECPPHQTCDIEQADIHRARAALAGSGEK